MKIARVAGGMLSATPAPLRWTQNVTVLPGPTDLRQCNIMSIIVSSPRRELAAGKRSSRREDHCVGAGRQSRRVSRAKGKNRAMVLSTA